MRLYRFQTNSTSEVGLPSIHPSSVVDPWGHRELGKQQNMPCSPRPLQKIRSKGPRWAQMEGWSVTQKPACHEASEPNAGGSRRICWLRWGEVTELLAGGSEKLSESLCRAERRAAAHDQLWTSLLISALLLSPGQRAKCSQRGKGVDLFWVTEQMSLDLRGRRCGL